MITPDERRDDTYPGCFSCYWHFEKRGICSRSRPDRQHHLQCRKGFESRRCNFLDESGELLPDLNEDGYDISGNGNIEDGHEQAHDSLEDLYQALEDAKTHIRIWKTEYERLDTEIKSHSTNDQPDSTED